MANSYPGGLETPKSIDKPTAFVGSSSEALVFARAARSLLDNDARVTVWNEGFFSPGTTTIEALINALPRFDFSIIILKSDDLIRSRNIEALSPRDNVIFELGLFMAHLGRNRTFIVCQQGTKLPTDLAGVATITYEHPQNSESANVSLTEAIEALGAACDRIREAIRDLGVSPTRTSKQLGQVAQRQDVLESKVRALQIVVKGIVTEFEWEKLDRLALDGQFLVRFHNDMQGVKLA